MQAQRRRNPADATSGYPEHKRLDEECDECTVDFPAASDSLNVTIADTRKWSAPATPVRILI